VNFSARPTVDSEQVEIGLEFYEVIPGKMILWHPLGIDSDEVRWQDQTDVEHDYAFQFMHLPYKWYATEVQHRMYSANGVSPCPTWTLESFKIPGRTNGCLLQVFYAMDPVHKWTLLVEVQEPKYADIDSDLHLSIKVVTLR